MCYDGLSLLLLFRAAAIDAAGIVWSGLCLLSCCEMRGARIYEHILVEQARTLRGIESPPALHAVSGSRVSALTPRFSR